MLSIFSVLQLEAFAIKCLDKFYNIKRKRRKCTKLKLELQFNFLRERLLDVISLATIYVYIVSEYLYFSFYVLEFRILDRTKYGEEINLFVIFFLRHIYVYKSIRCHIRILLPIFSAFLRKSSRMNE